MIGRLVTFSVEHRKLVAGLWVCAAIAAAIVASQLKFDALPDVTSNQVQVLTVGQGLIPEEIELRVTRPLEAALAAIPGLIEERSTSRYGLSAITLIFDEDADIFRIRQLVAERLTTIAGSLPAGVEPPELGPMTGGLGEIYQFTVSSPTRTPSELLELVTYRIAPILKTVPNVVEVNPWGGATRTLDVRADPARMASRGVTFAELRDALQGAIGSRPGASLESGREHVLLRARFRPTQPRELADLLVKPGTDAPVRVGDVADVVDGQMPRFGAATRNGSGETVYVMVQMLLRANALETTHLVRQKMADVRRALPPDVTVDVTYDRSQLVDATLRTVAKSLSEGGLLVCIVLFLMLGSVRAGLVVAATIPFAMLGTAATLAATGISGNLMSLGGIDFGLLVDGAVVLIERLFHHAEASTEASAGNTSQTTWPQRVARAFSSVARASFFGVTVVLIVYLPILTMRGVDGKLFRPMALTVVLCLIFALAFTLTALPAAAALFIRPKDVPTTAPRIARLAEAWHRRLLHSMLAHPLRVIGVSLAALVAAVLLIPRMGTELTPTLDEGSMVIQTVGPSQQSIRGAIERAGELERAARQVPEVLQIASRIGSPQVATDTMGIEQADIFVRLKPKDEWRRGLTNAGLIADLDAKIGAVAPELEISYTQPIQMRFNELLGGAPFDVVVNLIGEDRAVVGPFAHRVLTTVSKVKGVEDARILAPGDVSVDEVVPNSSAAALWGLTVADVLDLTGGLRQGVRVGETYDGMLAIPVMLRLGEVAPGPLALATTLAPTPKHGVVTLSELADIHRVESPVTLFRKNAERRLIIGFNVRGRQLGEVVADASAAVGNAAGLPDGVRVEWSGQFESLREAQARLALVIPAALALIALVLWIHFRERGPVLWVLSHVPFAVVGGLVALFARGMSLSISAGVGFIALWGIAVMNGTVLMTEVRHRERAGDDPATATLGAAADRARPVIMTAAVAALGFLPMALATGVGAEVQRPLATVLVGGLTTSTALTLFVLPVVRTFLIRWSPPQPSAALESVGRRG